VNTCTHDGFHSGEGRYDSASKTLHYVVVCDQCHEVVREVAVERYAPAFDAHGNDAFVSA
jgi:hypothetical protein